MFRILKKSLKTGVVTGQHPQATQPSEQSHSRRLARKPCRSDSP